MSNRPVTNRTSLRLYVENTLRGAMIGGPNGGWEGSVYTFPNILSKVGNPSSTYLWGKMGDTYINSDDVR